MRAETFTSVLVTKKGTYVNKRPPALVVTGSERKGIAAKNWNEDAVFANEKTSPRFEIPRVVLSTMRLVDAEHLHGRDLATYWFLFASARKQGIHKDRHCVTYSEIAKFLGIRDLKRIRDALDRLNATGVRYDCNQDGTRRQSAQLIEIAEFDPNVPFNGKTEIWFALPAVVRRAVQVSKDYAKVDINALSRLKSRYAVTLYIRLCYLSGMNDAARFAWKPTIEKMADLISFPRKAYKKQHLMAAVRSAIAEINGLTSLHRRYEFTVELPNEFTDEYEFTVGSSAKRLAEVAPAPVPDEEFEVLAARNVLPLEPHQYPTTLSLRQAQTMIGKSARLISHEWRVDVWGATHHGAVVCGMDAKLFLDTLRADGVEKSFDWWIDRLVFAPNGLRVRHGIEPPPFIKETPVVEETPVVVVPVVREVLKDRVIESEEVLDDDIKTAADYSHIEYGDVDVPPTLVEAPDMDDSDIPF